MVGANAEAHGYPAHRAQPTIELGFEPRQQELHDAGIDLFAATAANAPLGKPVRRTALNRCCSGGFLLRTAPGSVLEMLLRR
jgi:hypothetical protein